MSAKSHEAVGRNTPCPCGSGRKFKHCCLNRAHMAPRVIEVPGQENAALAAARHDEALRLLRSGLLDGAESSARAALQRQPDHVGALRVLANVLHRRGRAVEAAALLTRAAQAAPRNPVVQGELGLVLLGLERPAEAVEALRRALRLDPSNISARTNLGNALRQLGELDEAEAACRRVLEEAPQYAPALESLGEVLRQRGWLQQARESLEKAVELAPASPTAQCSLGDVLVEQGEFQAAVEHYRQGLATSTKPAGLHARLGVALREMQDEQPSLAALREAVRLDPGSPQAHYHLGQTLLMFGRFSEARDSAAECVRLRADRSNQVLHGATLVALGDLEAGVSTVKVGRAADSGRGESLGLLGTHLHDAGHASLALECFRKKLEIDPDDAITRHYVMSLSGVNPEQPSERYLRQVFDAYAGEFDRSLVGQLGYSVPGQLVRAVRAVSTLAPPWDAMDLGCGTGLVGAELAGAVQSLVGIDLSPKMLERAAERGIYTRLTCTDIVSALQAAPCASCDLITSADVFIYMGRLEAVFEGARDALRSGGLFAFSTEAAEDMPSSVKVTDGYCLGPRGRYAHTAQYLRSLARLFDFGVETFERIRVRLECHRPAMGWLAVLHKRSTS